MRDSHGFIQLVTVEKVRCAVEEEFMGLTERLDSKGSDGYCIFVAEEIDLKLETFTEIGYSDGESGSKGL